jgi:hypothetical protein
MEQLPPAIRRGYAPVPAVSTYGRGATRLVFGDADTLILIADPEPIYVATRTEAAWKRAVRVLGRPRDQDVKGPG